ncbi:hypothetical protein ACDY96_11335 [Rhizobium mongolense]|uniref:hypothetical protein n=1 Tax=Rhizobium TaxID=379 RepID=UPI0024B197D8|nr:hypothetical protein [Rhizobium sp. CC1099]WFU87775.1 hypothetical protein QA644_01355 [Rhizobium sp. CC1099]
MTDTEEFLEWREQLVKKYEYRPQLVDAAILIAVSQCVDGALKEQVLEALKAA